jgi:hypothetical protein
MQFVREKSPGELWHPVSEAAADLIYHADFTLIRTCGVSEFGAVSPRGIASRMAG